MTMARPKKKASKKRWISSVKTESTYPPPGLFTKSAATIARTLASPSVSPKGPASGMRMLTYFINRAGRGLSAERHAELEKPKLCFRHGYNANAQEQSPSALRK